MLGFKLSNVGKEAPKILQNMLKISTNEKY